MMWLEEPSGGGEQRTMVEGKILYAVRPNGTKLNENKVDMKRG